MPTAQEPMLTVRVSQEMMDALRSEAAERGCSVADLVRRAIDETWGGALDPAGGWLKADRFKKIKTKELEDRLREEGKMLRMEPPYQHAAMTTTPEEATELDVRWPSGVYSLGPSHPSAAAVGVIVKFLDADNDWQQRDLLVLKDGITGFVDIVDRTVAPVTTRDQAKRYGAAWLRQ